MKSNTILQKRLYSPHPGAPRPSRVLLFLTLALILAGNHKIYSQPAAWCSIPTTKVVAANETKKISQLYPGLTSITGAVIEINDHAVLEIDQTFTFKSCYFRFIGNYAQIHVKKYGTTTTTFIASSSKFFTRCGTGDMWDGIVVYPGSRINFNGCNIRDAGKSFLAAIQFPGNINGLGYNDLNNILTDNTFDMNYMCISAGSKVGTMSTLGFSQCYGNQFNGSPLTLKANFNQDNIGPIEIFGAIRLQRTIFTFGGWNGSTTPNTFYNLQYGIYANQSNVTVSNCNFTKIRDLVSNVNSTSGTGIYAFRSSLHVGKASHLGGGCNFDGIYTGLGSVNGILVESASGEIKIENASFMGEEMEYSIKITKPLNPYPIVIQNNDFSSTNGQESTDILIERQPGSGSNSISKITRNNFHSLSFKNIRVKGVSAGASDLFEISRNKFNTDGFYCGTSIFVSDMGDNYKVLWNEILIFQDGPFSPVRFTAGIRFWLTTGEHNEISNNTINGIFTHIPYDPNYDPIGESTSTIKYGIYIRASNATTVCSNTVNNCYGGIYYALHNGGISKLSNNTIGSNIYGLFFSRDHLLGGWDVGSTDLSAQVRTDNVWSPAASFPGGFAAKYADDYDAVVPVHFVYDPDQDSYPNTVPPTAMPPVEDWFEPMGGEHNSCAPPGSNFSPFADAEKRLAAGLSKFSYPVEEWDRKRQLWYILSKHPEWVSTDTDIRSFYLSDMGSSPNLFATAQYQIEQAYGILGSLTQPINILNNRIDVLSDNLNQIEDQIGDDPLHVDSELTESLANIMSELSQLQESLLGLTEQYSSVLGSKLQAIQPLVDALPNNTEYESSWKFILNCQIKKATDQQFSDGEIDNMRTIASTCPAIVGLAAQGVWNVMTCEQEDPFISQRVPIEGCIESQDRSKHTVNPQIEALRIFPNPANQHFTAEAPWATGGKWIMASATGIINAQGILSEGQHQIDIDVTLMAPGLYFFQVDGKDNQRRIAKVSIVK